MLIGTPNSQPAFILTTGDRPLAATSDAPKKRRLHVLWRDQRAQTAI